MTMDKATARLLKDWAEKYNDPQYFREDPIAFPRHFAELCRRGDASLKDVEVAAVVAAHLAWGRRSMIVRDTTRVMDEMGWRPYDYIMKGRGASSCGEPLYRDEPVSCHRTVKWSELAAIFARLRSFYQGWDSLEMLSPEKMRELVFAQKPDPKAPNKKINMMRRWMVRSDGKVDLGLWKDSDPKDLIIPLDVHVYDQANALGLTARRPKDLTTALEITDAFREIFPSDPVKGDFALFGYGVTHPKEK